MKMTNKMTPEEALRTIESLKGTLKEQKSKSFNNRVGTYVVTMVFLAIINRLTSPSYRWVMRPALGRGLGLALAFFRNDND